MTPITRLEKFLNGIVYGGTVPEPPITRIETMLNDIKNGDVVSLTPITREETFLAKISGANVEIPTPITRIEMFLAKICGVEIATPSPIVRIEHWLNEWASGEDPLGTFTGAIARFFSRASKPIVKLEADFTPIQNLNGQEAPWPAGGGKNKLNNTATTQTINDVTFTVNSDGSVSCSGTATGTAVLRIYQTFDYAENMILNGCPSGGSYASGYSVMVCNSTGSAVTGETGTSCDVGSGVTVPGASIQDIAQIQIIVRTGTNVTGKVFYPMLRLASVSDATYSPYSNICPISGHTGCEVVRTGKNLLNQDDSDYLNVETRAYGYSDSKIVAQLNKLKAGTYTLSLKAKCTSFEGADPASTNLGLYFRAVNNGTNFNVVGTISGVPVIGEEKSKTVTFTLTDDYVGKFASCFTYTGQSSTTPRVMYSSIIYDVQLELGSTATDYEPYSGTTVSISFGSTVYGGKLTVNEDGSGQVVADRTKEHYDEENAWAVASVAADGTYRFYVSGNPSAVENVGICDKFKLKNYQNRNDSNRGEAFYVSGGSRQVTTALATTKAEWETWLQNNGGIDMVVELVEPVTIPLTASQINTLVGENVVFVNGSTGNITVLAYGTEIT